MEVTVDGRRLTVGNLDKVFYPETGFTKGEVLNYYARIAPVMVPHLEGRGVTLRRYPDGVEGTSFYEKRCPSHRPGWVPTVAGPGDRRSRAEARGVRQAHGRSRSPGRDGDGGGPPAATEPTGPTGSAADERDSIQYCCLDSPAALAWAANIAALEIHAPMARASDVDSPAMCVFDLDPGAPAAMAECARVALEVRDLLDRVGLVALPKTSGSKGLQVYLPLNAPHTHEHCASFARAVAQVLERARPDGVTATMRRAERSGKVFVDWSQNSRHKTTVAVYSLRARPAPTVSTPVAWEEVEAAAAGEALSFEAGDVLERVAARGDLFAAALTTEQRLPRPST